MANEFTTFEVPTKIRWTERSKNIVTVPQGGYDLEPIGDAQTKVTIHNVFAAHGFGKLIVGFALRAAVKDGPDFAQRIKSRGRRSDRAARAAHEVQGIVPS